MKQPPPLTSSAALPARLLAAKIDLLARQFPALAAGTIVLAFGTAYILIHQQMPTVHVVAWLVAVLTLTALRIPVYRMYAKSARSPQSAPRWAVVLSAFSCMAGVLWGVLGVLFFVPQDPFTLAIVAIILSAILSSALNSLGPFWPAHIAFAVPCALPFAIECVTSNAPSLVVLGILTFFFLAFAETYARAIARSIEKSLLLRFENLDLLRELTAAKERAEAADDAKTRLLAAVSHDLRQPLYGLGLLASAVETAVREMPAADPLEASGIADTVQRMQQDCETMEQLVSRLLEASRLDSGQIEAKPQPCDVSALLRSISESVGEQARTKGLALRVRLPAQEQAHTDPVLLHSIVTNLVSNAIKYTNAGGVLLACRPRQGSVRIEVWDTGIGIPPDEVDLVLGEYYRAANANDHASGHHGFGLGLSIVSRLAALLGSRLQVRSRLGKGSVFVVELPRA